MVERRFKAINLVVFTQTLKHLKSLIKHEILFIIYLIKTCFTLTSIYGFNLC